MSGSRPRPARAGPAARASTALAPAQTVISDPRPDHRRLRVRGASASNCARTIPSPARAQRGADGDFTGPRRMARAEEQEIRDVRRTRSNSTGRVHRAPKSTRGQHLVPAKHVGQAARRGHGVPADLFGEPYSTIGAAGFCRDRLVPASGVMPAFGGRQPDVIRAPLYVTEIDTDRAPDGTQSWNTPVRKVELARA